MNDRPKILVVDDEKYNTEFLELFLSDYATVFPANNGQQALDLAQDSQFDLIISDINMLPMSGIDFGYRVRKLQPLTEIVFFSGEVNGANIYKDDIESIGNSRFIEKDFGKLKELANELFKKNSEN